MHYPQFGSMKLEKESDWRLSNGKWPSVSILISSHWTVSLTVNAPSPKIPLLHWHFSVGSVWSDTIMDVINREPGTWGSSGDGSNPTHPHFTYTWWNSLYTNPHHTCNLTFLSLTSSHLPSDELATIANHQWNPEINLNPRIPKRLNNQSDHFSLPSIPLLVSGDLGHRKSLVG